MIGMALPTAPFFFDGSHDEIKIENHLLPDLGEGAFSIVAWVNTSQEGAWKRIVTKRSGAMTPYGNWISLANHYGKARFEMFANGQLDSISAINDGVWHCLVIIRDLLSQTIALYVDGVNEGGHVG